MTEHSSRGTYISRWLKNQRLTRVGQWVRGDILDFGCNRGDLLDFCKPVTYVGYDLSEQQVAAARAMHPGHNFTSDFSMIQNSGKKFDVIVMAAVIEHLDDPLETLALLKPSLAPGGAIVLTTPHPAGRWLHELAASLGLLTGHANEQHKAFLDRADMARLANELGLQLTSSELFLFGFNQLFVLSLESTDTSVH